ncbi:hypothetical protein MIND_00555900 [Mycena indigotica]|uniref:Uncharacterized protein n=1 Tax=Mycena indigotica TaxID=2126181 RepID=A0A8H6W7E8_9AGAR|nr:uncharacterized protein MIND_00555900 [Mycena indigotica]KAF7307607.1 hypothetical protein MIND_00555900 [Mycena indigotica]
MTLRPILKALHISTTTTAPPDADASKLPISSNPLPFASCSSRMVMYSPHVHFPTQPCTLTGATHSPGTYDRAPISVSPNSCALPERGGRVYRSSIPLPLPTPKGSYFHPRAYEACEAPEQDREREFYFDCEEPDSLAVPELGFFSSESSECYTDECASPDPGSPPVRASTVQFAAATYESSPPLRSRHSREHVLSFLPHPHPSSHPPTPGLDLKRPRRKKPRPRRPPLSFRVSDDGDAHGCLDGF